MKNIFGIISLFILMVFSACNNNQSKQLSSNANVMRNINSLELAQEMIPGWNLGNSMEAVIKEEAVLSGDETAWGNPIITQQLIDSVKAAGFNSIRVPVSWSHQLVNDSTFQIKKEWLQRVAEVVNYALDNEMYVIINVHWDGGWMDHPYYTKQQAINHKLEVLWIQIANYFKDYNDYLIFAGTNEVHIENNWDAPTPENAEVQNSFNQTFVNTVRSTGGNNKLRQLIVQGYNTNIDHTVNEFILPTDVVENKLMVEVHYYDPFEFALDESKNFDPLWGKKHSGENVTNWGQEDHVDMQFAKMKSKFIDKGIPVILGEYGAMLRTNLTSGEDEHVDSRNYYLEYVTRAAVQNGMVPVYWDNGFTGNNGFGLFNRANGQQAYPDALQSIMKAVQSE